MGGCKIKGIEDLEPSEFEMSPIHVLVQLQNAEGIELKTEINNPFYLSLTKSLGKFLKSLGYTNSGDLLIDWIEIYLLYMVSNKRKSREEVIRAISHMLEDESKKSASEKLTSNMVK